MNEAHPEIGPELRKLAQAILDGIDPAMRAAAALAMGDGAGTGKCQQMWCPVCALAALVTGDEHPLLTVVAQHSLALLAAIRAAIDDLNGTGDGSRFPPPDGPPGGGISGSSRYQPIPVTVEE